MKTAVVILNWNGKRLLQEFLPSVVKNSTHSTVYVADNASTDDSVSYVKSTFPEVKVIQNQENGGFAKGYNEALAGLKEEVFVLLNSDVMVTEGWLPPLLKVLEQDPQVAIVQPKLLDYKKKTHFEYAGAAGGFVDKFGYPFCRGRIFATLEEDQGQFEVKTPIFWASGACLVIRRLVYEELGGLDEAYFAHQEEIDLCWRAFNAGHKAMYVPESKVYHLGGATLNAMNPQKTFYNFRNSLFNLLKNVPGTKAYFLIFIRLVLDGLAGIQYLVKGKPGHTWAILRAHYGFYGRFGEMRKKRLKRFSPEKYEKVNSIVLQYYLLNRKHFKNLRLKRKTEVA